MRQVRLYTHFTLAFGVFSLAGLPFSTSRSLFRPFSAGPIPPRRRRYRRLLYIRVRRRMRRPFPGGIRQRRVTSDPREPTRLLISWGALAFATRCHTIQVLRSRSIRCALPSRIFGAIALFTISNRDLQFQFLMRSCLPSSGRLRNGGARGYARLHN